ncbi:MAG TPA: hypothetical protein VGO47_12355 [Chlamydiales bacterium]|nr:hypothetical protein [Chlamydiales bacterium]
MNDSITSKSTEPPFPPRLPPAYKHQWLLLLSGFLCLIVTGGEPLPPNQIKSNRTFCFHSPPPAPKLCPHLPPSLLVYFQQISFKFPLEYFSLGHFHFNLLHVTYFLPLSPLCASHHELMHISFPCLTSLEKILLSRNGA